MRDLSRKVRMICPLCGNDLFERLDGEVNVSEDTPDKAKLRCSDCGSVYLKDELIAENQEVIDNTIKDIKEDFLIEVRKEMKSWNF